MPSATVTYQDGQTADFEVGPDNKLPLLNAFSPYSVEDVTGITLDVHPDAKKFAKDRRAEAAEAGMAAPAAPKPAKAKK